MPDSADHPRASFVSAMASDHRHHDAIDAPLPDASSFVDSPAHSPFGGPAFDDPGDDSAGIDELDVLDGDGLGDEEERAVATAWGELGPAVARREWPRLIAFVEGLVERFDLDFRTIPACWYRHNAIVEALVALRDYERACFHENAPLSSGLEFQRALREIEGRCREWTARTGCLARHVEDRPVTTSDSTANRDAFVAADLAARSERAIAYALEEG